MLPYSLYWRVIDGDCDPLRESLFRITTLSDFIIWSLIPLIGMTSATAIICWNIFRIRRSFQARKMPPFAQTTSSHSTFTYVCPPTRSSLPNRQGGVDRERILTTVAAGTITTNVSNHNPQNIILNMLSQHTMRATQTNARGFVGRGDKILSFTENVTTCVRPVNTGPNSQGQRHGATDNAGHVTRLLICMNIWYMISTYPLMIYLMFLNFIIEDMDRDIHKFMYYLSRSLCFLNACSNWIFYCASGRLFRQRIKQICRRFLRRFRFYSSSQSSGFNDYPANFARNTSHVLRDQCTIVPVHDRWANRRSWLSRKVYSADNLQFQVNNRMSYYCQPARTTTTAKDQQDPSPHRFGIITFVRNVLQNCHAFQCHCFCTKPLPCVVHTIPTESQTEAEDVEDDETRESVSHGTVFCPRTTVPSEHVCECVACCTGFCCWKFWWYGFSGGVMKDDSCFSATGIRDKSKPHSFGLTSSSSSLYFHSELARRHSHLRVRPSSHPHHQSHHSRRSHHHLYSYQNHNHYHQHQHHHHHHHHYHQAGQSRSDDRVREIEPSSSCVRESRVSRGLPENKLRDSSGIIRSNHDLYGSAPSNLICPSQGHGAVTSTAFPQSQLTIHTQPESQLRSSPTTISASHPVCYCYMSSLGKRQYHYHRCKLHENGEQTQPDDPVDWRIGPHHPFALIPLYTAQSEGRIRRALDGNRDEFVSLPPARQRSANVINPRSTNTLHISN
ncbi:unnamed protein product [Echinostoma caproni]|uniref:G_PROTEIN_RECEP_F1_2 domain-containing protein n=1 Tax=Echinostoma caproni TaxID=27848 RepID=A0A183AEW1_9TREM|nr:unnamed protein product [Echinostoma caproni]